tara:strand:- start:211 stop:432 length:222 start_codon:yes stop_codon:yes gene_type:complete
LRFANGALGTVEASWVQTGGMSGFEITGSEGTIFEHPDKGMLVTAPVKTQPRSPPAKHDRRRWIDSWRRFGVS